MPAASPRDSPPDVVVMEGASCCCAEHRAVDGSAAVLNPALPGNRPEPKNPCTPVTRTIEATAVHDGRMMLQSREEKVH